MLGKALRDDLMENRQKILLVDDETAITSNLSAFLERSGFDTAAAADGEEALQQVEAVDPDLIVLDVLMSSLLPGARYSADCARQETGHLSSC